MLIEAMACGVPVVASRSGEIPSRRRRCGAHRPRKRRAAWSPAIDRLLADAALRRDLSARGLARAHEKFALAGRRAGAPGVLRGVL